MSETPEMVERHRERARMEDTLNTVAQWVVFANARRMSASKHSRSPNWVFAMDLFGLGSTYAFAMCRRIGVDPDGTKPDRIDTALTAAKREHE